MKCEDHHIKKLITVLPYNCLYLNKGKNSSVKGSILTKLIGYRESMVLIICTKNELEDLKVLKRSPDLLSNVKIGQGQHRLFIQTYFVLPYMDSGHFDQVT